MADEIRLGFHQELDEIRTAIVHLAALVTEAIPRGTSSLLQSDLRLAQELIEDDDRLDVLALEIEDRCYHVLALQQPMASDLRAIVTALRLTSELERNGDLVVNICKGARRIYGSEISPVLHGFIQKMSDEALRLTKLALDAYVEADESLASALDDIDDQLDELHADYIEAIFNEQHDGRLDLRGAVQLALIGRYYERIGDHAVNIGERVQYMVTGWLPEHTGVARLKLRDEQRAHFGNDEGFPE